MADTRGARLTKALAEFITHARVCRLATSGVAAMPHVVPVCHVLHRGRIYVGSGDTGRKMSNIRENPRVAVVVDAYSDYWPTIHGVMVQGRARLIERGPRFRLIRDLLYAKYPLYRRRAALSPSDSFIIEITPTRAFSWDPD